MPTFKVLRRVDAFALYTAEIEAETAIEAASIARETDGRIEWIDTGISTFDAREFATIDEKGSPIPYTTTGDF